jgi:hypothetical protein
MNFRYQLINYCEIAHQTSRSRQIVQAVPKALYSNVIT